jgi:hypothetical protein
LGVSVDSLGCGLAALCPWVKSSIGFQTAKYTEYTKTKKHANDQRPEIEGEKKDETGEMPRSDAATV